jgi:hypothetical protein
LNKTVVAGTETITAQGFKYRQIGTTEWQTSTDGSLINLVPNTEYEFYAFANTATYQISGETLTFSTLLTGIDDILENSISIYPNPVNYELKIMNCEYRINAVEITDISGKVIYNSKFIIYNSINVSHLPEGVYLLKIMIDNNIFTKKIVKK